MILWSRENITFCETFATISSSTSTREIVLVSSLIASRTIYVYQLCVPIIYTFFIRLTGQGPCSTRIYVRRRIILLYRFHRIYKFTVHYYITYIILLSYRTRFPRRTTMIITRQGLYIRTISGVRMDTRNQNIFYEKCL